MQFDFTQFIDAGIPGLLLLWFMFRLERLLMRFDKTVQLMARAILRLLERHDPDMATRLSDELYRTNGSNSHDS
jgi:hypothetical protein